MRGSTSGKTHFFIITLALVMGVLTPVGCTKEKNTSNICDVNLNLNAPELQERNVMINGGVTAPVKRIEWNWGDGKVDKHLYFPAHHTYGAPGQYEIKVTVFSAKGCTEEKSVAVIIK